MFSRNGFGKLLSREKQTVNAVRGSVGFVAEKLFVTTCHETVSAAKYVFRDPSAVLGTALFCCVGYRVVLKRNIAIFFNAVVASEVQTRYARRIGAVRNIYEDIKSDIGGKFSGKCKSDVPSFTETSEDLLFGNHLGFGFLRS